ncbi:6182_t:CDS:2 [Dentiscutata erythropus]|uniref:6182_t:CDS:1 n=1 Tax=Dentiscutata erythropus TaxID=1348616 RepID=A0A9N8Z4L2_9GLOM|nr:6182_t:CDS:2 [Dentiscutata erythropus]
MKLRQIIKENTRHEVKNIKLKSRVRKLEAKLAILEQFKTIEADRRSTKGIRSRKDIKGYRDTVDTFLDEVQKKSISNKIRKCNREKKLSKARQEQISLQKISNTVVSSISSSEKPTSTKNGNELIQEISHNIDESNTLSI